MDHWRSLLEKLRIRTAIYLVNQELMSLEVNHWKENLQRLIAIVSNLLEYILAFCDQVFESGNGNLRRIKTKESMTLT